MNMITGPAMDDMLPAPPRPMARTMKLVFVPRRLIFGIPLVIACAVGGVLLGSVILRHVTPKFTSSVLIVIDPKRPGSYGADQEFANVYIDSSKVSSVETVLVSSGILQRVVQTLHLADDPLFGDRQPSLLARYLPFLVAEQKPPSPDTPALRQTRAEDALRRMITTGRVNTTYLIKLEVTAPNGELAQRAAQGIADAYIADLTESKMQAAQKDFVWLTERLKQQRDQVVQSEVDVEAIRKKFGLMSADNSNDTSMDRQSIKQVNEDLIKAQGDVAAAEARYEQAQHILQTNGNVGSLPDVADSHVIEELRKEQSDASRRMADVRSRYSSGHPAYKQAEHDQQAIDSQLSSEMDRILGALKNEYQTAVAHRDNLAHNVTRLMGSINAASNAEGRVELRQAERVAEANRIAYEASLSRLRDVEQQQTRFDVEARILSGAELPENPSSPKPLIFLGGGMVLGLLAGTAAAGLLCFRRNRIEDAPSAERDFLLPVLATIPDMRRAGQSANGKTTLPEYLITNPFSVFADSLRLLRLHLRGTIAGPTQVVQVTSSVAGEGKSTVASSLAVSAASAGIRTILLDLDLHQSSVGRMLGHAHDEGVIDVLTGSTDMDTVIRADKRLPIRVINAGSLASLHPGMIEGQMLRDLIHRCRRECDLVIIDTPPVLAISDALYVSALVDTTILVIGWRSTPQAIVDSALAALRSARAPVTGIVLNRVDPARMSGYCEPRYHSEGTTKGEALLF